jgi:hypothetical protein
MSLRQVLIGPFGRFASVLRLKPARALCPIVAAAFCGCASLPDGELNYYLAKSTVSVKVTRTVACDAASNLLVSNSVTPNVVHVADSQAKPGKISLVELRGAFSDSDVKVELFDDGRLKGINATGTGQGQTILDSAIKFTKALRVLEGPVEPPSTDACKYIKEHGGGKPLTIIYAADIDLDDSKQGIKQPVDSEPAGAPYAAELASRIGEVCVSFARNPEPQKPAEMRPRPQDLVIDLRQPGSASLEVFAGVGQCATTDAESVWQGAVAVAQFGRPYQLIIPKPPAFGQSVFAVSFDAAGSLQSVQYASTNGAAQALGVGNSLASAASNQSTADKVAAVKAEADLIFQQQRLVQCLADPGNCK